MPPSSSANNIAQAATPFPAIPQSEWPPPAIHMCASCPEFGTRDHYGSNSDMAGDEDSDLVFQTSSSSHIPSLPSDVEVIEVRGVMVEMEISEDESVYRTARVPQVEFTSPHEVVFHSISAGGTPSSSASRSPSRARALAKLAEKAKGIAKMLSLRRLSRKPSTEAFNPLVSSTSTVAVSGTWRDGAGGSAPRWSQASPRRPPISILVTSESRTDAVTYNMSPSARIMSSSSTTGIYTPDDDEFPHDDRYPQSPTPSLTTLGADAVRHLERALLDEDRDVFADTPSRRPAARAVTWNLSGRRTDPLPAPNTGATILRPRSAPPTAAVREAVAPSPPTPAPTPFPNLLRLLLFMPWCITVGATITLFPAHIERVVFSSGYIPAPSPRGIERFCFWADTARDYACIFGFALLSLFVVSPRLAWIACALALARLAWVWGPYACATGGGGGCCCVHVPERLGEDDMESLALIARGGDMANLVLRQCADHSGLRPSRAGLVNAVTVARDSSIPQK